MSTDLARLRHALTLLPGFVLCLAMLGLPHPANGADGASKALPLEDIIELKRMGFPEETIKREVSDAAGSYTLDPTAKTRLRQSGFSDAFIEYLGSLRAERIDNPAIVRMLDQGMPLPEILARIKRGQPAFDTAPLVLLDLHKRHKAPKWLIRAMRGQPLKLDEIEALGRERVPPDQQQLLLDILGTESLQLDNAQMLKLLRAGVAGETVRRLRSTATVPEAAADLPHAGYYPHPLGLFTLRYPAGWRLLKEIDGDSVDYVITPETTVNDPNALDVGLQLMILPVDPSSILADMTPTQALEQIMPMIFQQEPGLSAVGEAATVSLGDLPAAQRRLTGSLSGRSGRFDGELTMTFREGRMALILCMAPAARWNDFSGEFARVKRDSVFLAPPAAKRRESPLAAQRMVADYRDSVVSITQYRGDQARGTGTGFIVREDGYVLTNHHVIWDSEKKQPATRFTVEWDAETGLPKAEAKLVGYRYTSTYQGELLPGLSSGIDIALLKLPDGRRYKPLPLVPTREVKLADPVLTLGFPARGMIQTLSTIVTSGIVTRLNRNFAGQLESIYIDAPIAHGSSGGPSLDLMLGRVFGLNTFGAFGISGVEDLWNYFGVIPIDYALTEYPLTTRVSLAREQQLDAAELYDLALHSRSGGATVGALAVARRALALASSADTHYLVGRLTLEQAADKPEIEAGLKQLEQALNLQPDHLPSLTFLAQAHLQLGDIDKAQRFAERAVKTHADDPDTYETSALVNLAGKHYERALADLEIAKRLTREVLPSPYLLAGETRYAMKHYGEGLREFQQAVKIHPANLAARIGVARYYSLTDQPVAALLEYGRIAHDMPGHPDVLHAMGEAYLSVDKPDKAMESYLAAIDRSQKLGMLPPAETYLGGARAALSKKVDNPGTALAFYLGLLSNYWGEESAFDGHLGIARLLQNHQQYRAIALGHLNWALGLRKDDPEAAELMRKLADARLSLDAIKAMTNELGYPAAIAGLVVRETPLDFRVEPTQQSMDELRKALPGEVALAIFLSQERHQAARADGAALNRDLLGVWSSALREEATGNYAGELLLELEAAARYRIEVRSQNETVSEHGVYRATGDRIRLTADSGDVSEYRYRISGNQLLLSGGDAGNLVFTRRR